MRGSLEHLIVRRGIWEDLGNDVSLKEGESKTGKSLCLTYCSRELVPEAKLHMSYSWVLEVPFPNPGIQEHVHDYDEILFFMGSDRENPEELHGELDLYLEGEPYRIRETAFVYIPAGVRHCPLDYLRVDRPHQFISLSLTPAYASRGTGSAS